MKIISCFSNAASETPQVIMAAMDPQQQKQTEMKPCSAVCSLSWLSEYSCWSHLTSLTFYQCTLRKLTFHINFHSASLVHY